MTHFKTMTPREVRSEMNTIENWVRDHEESFSDQVDLLLTRSLIESAHTETHLIALKGFLREVVK